MKMIGSHVVLTVCFGVVECAALGQAVDCGKFHSLAVCDDGTPQTWGWDSHGQLGLGVIPSPPCYCDSVPGIVSGIQAIVAVAGGDDHSLALAAGGSIWVWGSDGSNQLGPLQDGDSNVPVLLPNLSGIVEIAAGGDQCFARRSDGTIWGWGKNGNAQLGDGTAAFTDSIVQVLGVINAIGVTTGYAHGVALVQGGAVWIWGSNLQGQLGDGMVASGACWCDSVPAEMVNITGPIEKVSAGANHTIALAEDGSMWSWGANGTGQLGLGIASTNTCQCIATPGQISGLTDIRDIAGGGFHSLALKDDGTVWAWGWNESGQLGDGTTADHFEPTQVVGLTNIVAISAGWRHSLAVRSDGTLWAWGYNATGSLGEGSTMFRVLPTQVSLGCTVASSPEAARDIGSLVYPNPTVGPLNVSAPSSLRNAELCVFSTLGSTVVPCRAFSHSTFVDLTEEAPGVYFAVVRTSQGVSTERILKQ